MSISSPANNATFAALANISITASATAASGATISKVEFFNGGTLLGTDTTSPYTFTWSSVPGGSYSLTAKATDSKAATKTSTAVAVTVTAPPPPTVSISAPANNASFAAPANISINATATAGSGASISKVEFFNGAALLGSKTTPPYTFAWNTVAAGNYVLTAKASDNKGSVTTSVPVSIAVQIPSVPPSVSITAPVSGAIYMAPASFPITATATANAGGATITKVDFFNGATLLGTATTAPYSISLTNVPPGEFLLSAKATDSLGTSATTVLSYAVVDGADTCTTTPPLTANDPASKFAAFDKLPMTFEANAGQSNAEVRFQARGAGYQFFLTPEERVLTLLSHSRHTAETRNSARAPEVVAVRMRFIGANANPVMAGVDAVGQKSHYLIGRDPAAWHTNIEHFAKVRYGNLYPGIDEVYYGTQGKLEYDLEVAPGANPQAIRFALDGVERIELDARGDLLLKTTLGTLVQKEPVAYQVIEGQRHTVKAAYLILAANEVAFQIGQFDSSYPLVIDPVLVYSTYVGGTNNASGANGIAISRCGEAFIAGWTYATNYPTTAGAFEPSAVIGADLQMGFVSKLNQSGTGLLYSTYITGTIQDYGDGFPLTQYSTVNSVAVDATGHAYIAGNTSATDFPTTPGSLYPLPAFAAPSSFTARLNSDGSAFMYSTYMPSGNLASIAVDAAGSAYAAGERMVWKLNPSGSALSYSMAVGGSGQNNSAEAIAVDNSGNAIVAGIVSTNDLPVTAGAFQVTRPNVLTTSGFVAKINPAGTGLVYGTYVGTTGNVQVFGLALDLAGNAYLTGKADIKSVIPNFTGTYTSFNQNADITGNGYAFAAKLSADGSSLGYFSRLGGANCGVSTCGVAQTQGNAIAVDASGHAWMTGSTQSNQIPLVKPLQSTFASAPPNFGTDLFAVKFSPTGNSLVFSTLLGGQTPASPAPNGPNAPEATGIAIDSVGSAYVSGMSNTTDFPTTPGAFQPVLGTCAGLSAFVAKINETKDTTTVLAVTPNPAPAGSAITLTANITGNMPTGTVAFLDGVVTLGTGAVASGGAVFTTSALAGGAHSLAAAYGGDVLNNPSTAPAVAVNITNPGVFPTVTLTGTNGLSDGATLIANAGANYSGAHVDVNANSAAGNTLGVVRVYEDGTDTFWNTSATSFASGLNLSLLAPGFHSAYATATDNFAHTSTSAPIRFVVNPAAATPPTVTITAPANGANFTAPGPIAIAVTATPAGSNTITSVSYYQGTTPIGTAGAAPFSFTWNSVPAGTHSIVAVAVDNANGRKLSAPITVTVAPAPGVPSAPSLVSATAGPGGATLTFSAPGSNGGAAITGYTGTCSAAGQTTMTATGAANASSIVVTGLTGGVAYGCTVAATNSYGTGAASNNINVTPAAAPTIAITAPANNATLGSTSPVDIIVTAQVVPNTITKLEIFDGTTLLTTFTPTGLSSLTATFTWSGITMGSHTLSAKVTDSQGTVTSSAPVTVQVLASPTIALSTLSNYYLAQSSVDLNTTATAGGSATVTKVEFFRNNGATLIGTVTTAPYNFRWPNAAAGSYTFTAKVTDSQGLVTTSAPVSVTVGSSVAIQLAPGVNGTTVSDDNITLTGTVQAPPNSGLLINGQLATIDIDGQFAANGVPLLAATNTITATVTAPDGETATQTITVNRATSVANGELIAPGFRVSLDSNEGIIVPGGTFSAEVTLENTTGQLVNSVSLTCVAPVPATVVSFGKTTCTYTAPGTYRVEVLVRDTSDAVVYSKTHLVTVRNASQYFALVKGVYAEVIDRLKAGNKMAALNLFFGHAKPLHDAIFTALGPSLATFSAQGGTLSATTASRDSAELTVIRTVGAENRAFFIYLMRGEDGIWRIESM
ncbi:MAG: Ig-like domain-containing protein [Betaproteobacteria bacterium]